MLFFAFTLKSVFYKQKQWLKKSKFTGTLAHNVFICKIIFTIIMDNHQHYMTIALNEAKKALRAKEFPVGCVLVHNGHILATGKRQNSVTGIRHGKKVAANELDHAEIVALRALLADHPEIAPEEITLYCSMEPCLMCFAALLLSNIHTIVYAYEDAMGGGTGLNLSHLTPLYQQMKVTIIPNVLREESLSLFKIFFADPENLYWRNSYLAEYTLAQD